MSVALFGRRLRLSLTVLAILVGALFVAAPAARAADPRPTVPAAPVGAVKPPVPDAVPCSGQAPSGARSGVCLQHDPAAASLADDAATTPPGASKCRDVRGKTSLAASCATSTTQTGPKQKSTSDTSAASSVVTELFGDRDTADQLHAANLTATSPFDVAATPYLIYIRNVTTNTLEAACAAGSTCSTQVRSSQTGPMQYEAWVGQYEDEQPSDIAAAISDPWTISWEASADLRVQAGASVVVAGEWGYVAAIAGVDISNSDYQIFVRNDTTGEIFSCNTGDGCGAESYSDEPATYHYSAWIGSLTPDGEPGDVQAVTTEQAEVKYVSGLHDFDQYYGSYPQCSDWTDERQLCVSGNYTSNTRPSAQPDEVPPPDEEDTCPSSDRLHYCREYEDHLIVYGSDGESGRADYTVRTEATLDPTSTYYTLHVRYEFTNVYGDADAATMQAFVTCLADCTSDGSVNTTGLYEGKVVNEDFEITAGTPQRNTVSAHQTGLVTYFLLITDSTLEISTPEIAQYEPGVRCDDALPETNTFAGCVLADIVPTIRYGLTNSFPELATHIQEALTSGLKGSATEYDFLPLRRAPGRFSALSRNIACPRSGPRAYPRPTGKSCDEYPFASTFQGAFFTDGGPRTFQDCGITLGQPSSTGVDGYSVCMIDAGQNSGGGSSLTAQQRQYRVLIQDQYLVEIVPFIVGGP